MPRIAAGSARSVAPRVVALPDASETGEGMTRSDLRLLPVAVGVWGAALLGVFWPPMTWWSAGACGVGAVIVLLAARRMEGPTRAGLAIVLLSAMAAVSISVGAALPAREQAVESGGRVVEVFAGVTSSASIGQDGRLWFEAQTETIGVRGQPRPTSVPVRIGVEPGNGFDLGAVVRVVGEAERTDAGERSVLVVYTSEAEVVRPAGGVFGVAADLRQSFIERAARLPEPGAALLPGLAVGDTRAVSTELNDDMRTTGLSHLTAVSGRGSLRPSERRDWDESPGLIPDQRKYLRPPCNLNLTHL